jgi:sodium-dependent phosphate cotransporter
LLAATAVTGPLAAAALQIALVHLIYNTLAVAVIYGLPFLRYLPLDGANWMANLASEKRMLALSYIVFTFFIIPCSLIGVTSYFG